MNTNLKRFFNVGGDVFDVGGRHSQVKLGQVFDGKGVKVGFRVKGVDNIVDAGDKLKLGLKQRRFVGFGQKTGQLKGKPISGKKEN